MCEMVRGAYASLPPLTLSPSQLLNFATFSRVFFPLFAHIYMYIAINRMKSALIVLGVWSCLYAMKKTHLADTYTIYTD